MSKGEKYDHAPNMAALQTYQTSFATGDLDKLIEVMVSFECSLMQSSLCPSLMRMPQDIEVLVSLIIIITFLNNHEGCQL